MAESHERVCVTCGAVEIDAVLEMCAICGRFFCSDCACRGGFGRRFCSIECTRAYYFAGDTDDDHDTDFEE